jgi:CheY-like chemotaxis protein
VDSVPAVIAFTAKAFKEDRDICQAAGLNDFLSKPIYVTDLLAMLDKWVTIGSAQGAAFESKTQ